MNSIGGNCGWWSVGMRGRRWWEVIGVVGVEQEEEVVVERVWQWWHAQFGPIGDHSGSCGPTARAACQTSRVRSTPRPRPRPHLRPRPPTPSTARHPLIRCSAGGGIRMLCWIIALVAGAVGHSHRPYGDFRQGERATARHCDTAYRASSSKHCGCTATILRAACTKHLG